MYVCDLYVCMYVTCMYVCDLYVCDLYVCDLYVCDRAVGSKSEVVRPLHAWPNQLADIGESIWWRFHFAEEIFSLSC